MAHFDSVVNRSKVASFVEFVDFVVGGGFFVGSFREENSRVRAEEPQLAIVSGRATKEISKFKRPE